MKASTKIKLFQAITYTLGWTCTLADGNNGQSRNRIFFSVADDFELCEKLLSNRMIFFSYSNLN